MYPYFLPDVFNYTIPMYDLMIVIGLFLMLFFVGSHLEKTHGYSKKQANRILILIVVSLGFALLSSYLFDGVFHSIKNGELTFGSITFIGGLIGGVVSFLVLLKYFYKDDNKNVKQIMNVVITGVVLAHAFGRIGCFFAGCCYGIPTESYLGIVFPHGLAHHAHPDTAIYPTQLFEAFFLFALFFVLIRVKKFRSIETEIYLISYGIARIIIELFRGDDRGSFLGFITTEYNVFPTPSQYLSLLMIILGVYLLIRAHSRKIKHTS